MRQITRVTTLTLLAAFGGSALAQSWFQPYTAPRASHESRVASCANPTPKKRVAMDDWLQPANRLITTVIFYGNLRHPAQGLRPYYLAIYRNRTGACMPVQPAIYRACIVPVAAPSIAVDCTGRTVYKMYASMPAFAAKANQRYWIQISEDDSASIAPGLEDFRWSGRRPQLHCPALQLTSSGAIVQPLLDRCDNLRNDLAFELYP